jgi:atypical dual specificity phosphatase
MQAVIERLRGDREFRRQLYTSPRAMLAAYDLTDDERLRLMLPNFSWVLPGQLAGAARLASTDALDALHRCGVRALVSLVEDPLPPEPVRRAGLECAHLPIVDFTAPTREQIQAMVAAIDGFLARGLPVAVHCAGGLGRTGTVLACYLVHQGMTAADSITTIRARRPGSIETPEQEAAVHQYERYLTQAQQAQGRERE